MSDTFTYHGKELTYFRHMYNLTMFNERAVEIAIAHDWLEEIMGDDEHPTVWSEGLEVGNVLGHYEYHKHTVFDLHEEAAWYQKLGGQQVVSVDITENKSDAYARFPWVVSISTIEHTEHPVWALSILHDYVKPGGRLLVTFPTGVHDDLDELVRLGSDYFTSGKFCTIARTEDGWAQTEVPEVREYGQWANSVAVWEWDRLT